MKYVIKVNANRGRFFGFNSGPVICGSFFEFPLTVNSGAKMDYTQMFQAFIVRVQK